jgi:putative ABC transport system ATP-binding protein
MNPILSLHNVTRTYPLGESTVHALRGVNVELERGSVHAIVGPSGSGKSTLLHIVGGMDLPTAGEVHFDGQRLDQLSARELTRLRARHVGFVFQAFHLTPILDVCGNVALALRFIGVPRREARRRAAAGLERVGLGHRLTHRPAQLSGGERQRVAVARALVKEPTVILADEPTGNLDTETGERVIDLLESVNRQFGTTVVMVTHDRDLAARADFVHRMRDGRLFGEENAAA